MKDLKSLQYGCAIEQILGNSKGVLMIEDCGGLPKHLLIDQQQRSVSLLVAQCFGEL